MARFILFSLVSFVLRGVDSEILLRNGEPVVTTVFIRLACDYRLEADVLTPCIRYPVPTNHRNGAYIRLNYEPYIWDLVRAKVGGYHVRTCNTRNYCLYWYSSHIDNWDYLTLSDRPISRYFFVERGDIKHKKATNHYSGYMLYLSPREPYEAKGYVIFSAENSRYDMLSYTKKSSTWLIRDDEYWTFLVSPEPRGRVPRVSCRGKRSAPEKRSARAPRTSLHPRRHSQSTNPARREWVKRVMDKAKGILCG